ncbi:metallophosphatase domain-containing protein [Beggiatoa leptomitoformis]|uniref:Metallophosphoesterase n=1 Tax=Beggiatoa leptomitoformis TaxID=288004 RepID=A0A2N9YBK9_9GAMM|nr:metallophosphatase domain-containing protein [Beggiatoa leptomitoformis]ALG66798.1 metallophosphoesterase [Beggiatoa leptomitoformis]AUI67855.1 metallophosphoesterase [Beggiatoa leptomitoformis]
MKIVLISDTHGFHHDIKLPEGDILIHAGDISEHGTFAEIREFDAFLSTLPHRYKIFTAGNHDWAFYQRPQEAVALIKHGIYLHDESIEIEGLKIYGSAWQPRFLNMAFNLSRGQALAEKWQLIPTDTNILVTHTPPYGIGDMVATGEHVGCEALRTVVRQLQLQLHVFGHIHECYGYYQDKQTAYVNAASCNLRYSPRNLPIVIEI